MLEKHGDGGGNTRHTNNKSELFQLARAALALDDGQTVLERGLGVV